MANFHSILSECERAIQYLEDELKTLKIGMRQECDFTTKAIDLCGEAIRTLKKFVVEIGFENQKDEVVILFLHRKIAQIRFSACLVN